MLLPSPSRRLRKSWHRMRYTIHHTVYGVNRAVDPRAVRPTRAQVLLQQTTNNTWHVVMKSSCRLIRRYFYVARLELGDSEAPWIGFGEVSAIACNPRTLSPTLANDLRAPGWLFQLPEYCSLYTPLVSLTSVKTIADKSMSAVETTMIAQPSAVSADLQTPAHYEESKIFF